MQLMPTTLQHFGAGKKSSPEQQIKAGVKYIKSLDQAFARLIFDPKERINFILASYNIGPGHIFDAQKLAPKMGKNPKKWFNNVDTCLLSKSDPENYNDPLVEPSLLEFLKRDSNGLLAAVQSARARITPVIGEEAPLTHLPPPGQWQVKLLRGAPMITIS